MPVYHIWNEHNCTLGLWRITEDEDALRRGAELTSRDEERLLTMRHPERRLGLLASRSLMPHMGINQQQLSFSATGKPFVPSGPHLSISHCKGWAGVVVSQQPVGLDLELYRPKVVHVAERMFRPEELNSFARKDPGMLTFLWGAKESLYKLHGLRGLDFRREIMLERDADDPPLFARGTVGPQAQAALIHGTPMPGGLVVYAVAHHNHENP